MQIKVLNVYFNYKFKVYQLNIVALSYKCFNSDFL